MNSRSSRLNHTGSRACGAYPPPATVARVPPVSSASRAPASQGRMWSSSPWTTRTGQRTRPASSVAPSMLVAGPTRPRMVAISVSGSVSNPQPTASSIALVEWGSEKISPQKNSRNSR